MKTLITLVALLGAGIGGWKFFEKKESEAYQAYVKFSDALFEDRHHDAEVLAQGETALATVEEEKWALARLGSSRGVVHYAERKIDSETTSADGKTVTLSVTVDARRCAPCEGAIGPATVRYKHSVVMVQTDGGWKVDSFASEATPLRKE